MKKSKKSGNVNIAENNLTAFMKGMKDNDNRQLVTNRQATKEFLEEELRIYRKKNYGGHGQGASRPHGR